MLDQQLIHYVGPKVQARIQEFIAELKKNSVYKMFLNEEEYENFYRLLRLNPMFHHLTKFNTDNFMEWSITNDLASMLGTTSDSKIFDYIDKLFAVKNSEDGFMVFALFARAAICSGVKYFIYKTKKSSKHSL